MGRARIPVSEIGPGGHVFHEAAAYPAESLAYPSSLIAPSRFNLQRGCAEERE